MRATEDPAANAAEQRYLRAIAVALVAYGVISSVCWALTREHPRMSGAGWLWLVAMGTSAVYVALGAYLGVAGRRALEAVRIGVGSLLLTATIYGVLEVPDGLLPDAARASLDAVLMHKGLVPAFTFFSAVPFLSLVFARPRTIRAAISFAGVGLFAALLMVLSGVELRRPVLTGPPVTFEVLRVDDDADVIDEPNLPANLHVVDEMVGGRRHPFFHYVAPPGTHFDEARRQADAAIGPHVHLPEGTRIVWGVDPVKPAMVLHSYLVRGPAFITAADVESADAFTDERAGEAGVDVHLRSAGARRLRDVTRQSVGRRLAILFDGGVQIAPVVKSEIVGGRLQIAIAQMTREQAEGLAAGIRGELLHGP